MGVSQSQESERSQENHGSTINPQNQKSSKMGASQSQESPTRIPNHGNTYTTDTQNQKSYAQYQKSSKMGASHSQDQSPPSTQNHGNTTDTQNQKGYVQYQKSSKMGASHSQESPQSIQNHGNTINTQNQKSYVHQLEKTADRPEVADARDKAKEKTQIINQFPHNYEAILRDADSRVDRSSTDSLLSQLHAGVFLNKNRKKYWVDKRSNKNCFMLFARDFSITWGEDERYWKWSSEIQKTSDVPIELAELLQVCWFEVAGKFDVANLSPETSYRVILVVMLKDEAFGWQIPVSMRLSLPNGMTVERKENLNTKPREQWIEITVGEFITSSNDVGELSIYVHEYSAGIWRGGLKLKGVVILPTN